MSRRPRTQTIEADEALPEIDRLEGARHPRDTGVLFGHGAAEATLREGILSGRLHHAWLLSGPEGIGRATLAYRFARFALGGPSERGSDVASGLAVALDSVVARQVSAMAHPGLLVIRRAYNPQTKKFQQSISVDEVRRLRGFLGLTSASASWRIVIVDRADEMNLNAANALLKSLEEPPARAVFLLVAGEAGRLLPTIRSRCRTLEMASLAEPDLVQALAAAGVSPIEPAERSRLVYLAKGSVRHAMTLLSGGGLDLYQAILQHLSALPRLDFEAVHKLADELSPAAAEPRWMLFCRLLQDALSRVAMAAATGEMMEKAEHAIAAKFSAPEKLARLAELWETIGREKAGTLALNLDRKAFILDVFFRLEQTSRDTG